MSGAYFTVITKAYLSYARVLMARIRNFNPNAQQYVFFADNEDGYFNRENFSFECIFPEDFLAPSTMEDLTFKYDAFELCNVLKAFAHRYMMERTSLEKWIYVDSDIVPIDDMMKLIDGEDHGSIFITPHTNRPSDEMHVSQESPQLKYGIYNGGWLGIRRSDDSRMFVDWFVTRLKSHGFREYRNAFVDQLWLNFAPLHLDGVLVIKNDGANIAYWNLFERELSKNDRGDIFSNGVPVVFLHLSGWSLKRPELLSRHFGMAPVPPAIKDIMTAYGEELLSAGWNGCQSWGYSWSHYKNGRVIRLEDRRKYADACELLDETSRVNPFLGETLLKDSPTKLILVCKRELFQACRKLFDGFARYLGFS